MLEGAAVATGSWPRASNQDQIMVGQNQSQVRALKAKS
jgi:hypothetical protein